MGEKPRPRGWAPVILLMAAVLAAACDAPLTEPMASGAQPAVTAAVPGVRPVGTSANLAGASAPTDTRVLIDFEGLPLDNGASVEGLGTLHPLLDLRSTADPAGDADGDGETRAVLIEEGRHPIAYSTAGGPNGCLGDPGGEANTASGAHGFSDPEATISNPRVPHSYAFRFREGTTVSEFSILMLDHGDFLQGGRFPISVTLTAFDASGDLVDEDVATVESRTPLGDACRISEGDPGVRTLSVSGNGITRLTLRQSSEGWDAGLGFDDIRFTVETPLRVQIDVKPGSDENPVNLRSRGLLPVAILTDGEFDAADVDPLTATLGDGSGDDTPVATRGRGTPMASLEDVDGDGDLDLVVHFEIPRLVADGNLTEETTSLLLEALMTDRRPIRGRDSVRLAGS